MVEVCAGRRWLPAACRPVEPSLGLRTATRLVADLTQLAFTSQLSSAVPSDPLAAPGAVTLDLLGEFTLRVREGPIVVRRAQQRLLAFLAVSRRPVSRGALSQRLWEAVDDRRGSSALRSNLWRLPRPTGLPLVTTTATHVALSDAVVVDLWSRERIAKLLRQPRPSAEDRRSEAPETAAVAEDGGAGEAPGEDLAESHAMWTEDLLPEWSEDWLMVEQESYRQLRLHALENLSEQLRGDGQYAPALTAALAAVHADPLRESAHRQVIAVHLEEGNSAEALRQFHVYRRLLAHELGLPPSPTIRELVGPLLGRPLENPRRRRS
jgi:DNA-binding SARP family transcriptional activator